MASPTTTATCSSTRLSFVSERSGRLQIYSLDIRDPLKASRITRLPGAALDPTWSPDGGRLAFRWFRPRTRAVGVYVARADGSDVMLLLDKAVTPAWSPDGRLIAYAHPNVRGISVIQVGEALRGDRSTIRVLVHTAEQAEYPHWSADGTRLLFAGYRTGSFDLWVVDANGQHLRDLTPQPSLEYGATWSPDGKLIVFESNRDSTSQSGGDLYTITSDGRTIRRLTQGGNNYGPAWSPDGRWIAFNSRRDGNNEIYLMRPDGTQQRRLTHDRHEDLLASWVGRCRR
jgi:Tol biopolymer transport system component